MLESSAMAAPRNLDSEQASVELGSIPPVISKINSETEFSSVFQKVRPKAFEVALFIRLVGDDCVMTVESSPRLVHKLEMHEWKFLNEMRSYPRCVVFQAGGVWVVTLFTSAGATMRRIARCRDCCQEQHDFNKRHKITTGSSAQSDQTNEFHAHVNTRPWKAFSKEDWIVWGSTFPCGIQAQPNP